ncbi:MAG: nucleoside hydrolase [Ignavibacteria bacterium]|nr:nucleoside hydrolase [Ignavibacteria bacterium]
MPKPILIDTDPGVDDALALILALRSPELSVKAITTVAGNVGVRKCTRNALKILRLMDLPQVPAVAQGASKPLCRRLFTAPEVHGEDGLGGIRWLSPLNRAKVPEHAADVIIRCCRTSAGRLTIVAVGPLTNLALAWKKDPAALRKAGRFITMGGAFRVPGNTGPVAEFNYFVDPEAAHTFLHSGLPITVVPLDVTQQVVLMRKELEYRARRRANLVGKAILDFTRSYMLRHKMTQGFNGGYLHDPLAVAAAIDDSIIETRRTHVDVETTGRFTRGMTVADFRMKARSVDPAVAFKIDRDRFFKLFHERIWL